MKKSIIVAVYNRSETLEKCLQSIRSSCDKDFELIVVDDGSPDPRTFSLANQYADKVVRHDTNRGQSAARDSGSHCAKGEVLVFIDSDIVIKPESLSLIENYFSTHPDVDALCGRLSKEHPNHDFFSQYKNLYMNYIFGLLPERINFLYGSIHAIRREAHPGHTSDVVDITDDTALGQKLAHAGKKIAFLKDLEVTHLKKHNFFSFVKNDFMIPYEWAQIFIHDHGWKELGKNKGGYLHSPKKQLFSLIAVVFIVFSLALNVLMVDASPCLLIAVIGWFILNMDFFIFLFKTNGLLFLLASIFVTFMDHLVMITGILAGFITYWLKQKDENKV